MPQRAPTETRYYSDTRDRSDAALASANRNGAGASTAFDTSEADTIWARLNITAVGATPTLDARLETTYDGTNYHTVASWPQKTSVSTDKRGFRGLGHLSRWAWTASAGGITFAIDQVEAQRG